jgi:hypothetical protein
MFYYSVVIEHNSSIIGDRALSEYRSERHWAVVVATSCGGAGYDKVRLLRHDTSKGLQLFGGNHLVSWAGTTANCLPHSLLSDL